MRTLQENDPDLVVADNGGVKETIPANTAEVSAGTS